MQIQSIDFIDTEYRDELLGLLREKVFHLTTAKAYRKIRKEGFIFSNQDEKYPLNTGSLKSFGRYNGWVCLFDLRCKSDEEIENALMCYYFLGPSWLKEYYQDIQSTDSFIFSCQRLATTDWYQIAREGHRTMDRVILNMFPALSAGSRDDCLFT